MFRVDHAGQIVIAFAGASCDIRLVYCGNDVCFVLFGVVNANVDVGGDSLCFRGNYVFQDIFQSLHLVHDTFTVDVLNTDKGDEMIGMGTAAECHVRQKQIQRFGYLAENRISGIIAAFDIDVVKIRDIKSASRL